VNLRFERCLPTLFAAVVFVVVAGALIWTARGNYHDFVTAQQGAMRRSAAGAARETGLLVGDLARRLALLLEAYPPRLSAPPTDAELRVARQALRQRLGRDLSAVRDVVLADARGRTLQASAPLGAPARADLRTFASQRKGPVAALHRGAAGTYVDIPVRWTSSAGLQGIALVRFSPRIIVEPLRASELDGHRLDLVRAGGQGRVLLSSADSGAHVPDRLGPAERARASAARPIPGTRWQLIDVPDAALFSGRAARERDQVLIALSGIALLAMLFVAGLWRKETQRLAAERSLVDSRDQLEQRVGERTQALRRSHEGLEREVLERRRAEWLRSSHQEFLRLIAEGRPLPQTLRHLARYVERQFPGVRCTLMIREEKDEVLRLVAAPSLPAAFRGEFSRVPIADPGPVCAVAASRREPVSLGDLRGESAAVPMMGALEAAGIAAAWARPVLGGDGQVLGTITLFFGEPREPSTDEREVMAILVDVAGIAIVRCRAEAQMRKLSGAIEQTDDIVVITDRSGVIEYVNPAFEAASGFSREQAVGGTPGISKSGLHDGEFYRQMWRTILRGEVFRDVLINRRRDGSLYYEEKTITPFKDDAGTVTHFVSTGKDITERMEAQEHLHYLAHHDALTGLPNRALLQDRLAHAIAQCARSDTMLAVLFFDLDRFKNVNDSLGHATGDDLLKAVVERVSACVRRGDTFARLSGDEFTIVMEGLDDTDDVSAVAEKVLAAVRAPTLAGGHEMLVTASIGISIYPHDARDIENLLKHADSAMYRAKETGGNSYQYFTADMTAHAVEHLKLHSQVHRALERGEFILHYQPRIDVRDGHVLGVEALLRWEHPEYGLVSPAQFIPLLEETGLILEVGEWVLKTACRINRRLSEATGRPLRIAVNLSTRQFRDQDLLGKVRRCLEEDDLQPEQLELEITESLLADRIEQTAETLRILQAMGVRISVDDFGTGYSSMGYLKRFPIGRLKIDRSFVRDIPGDENDTGIVRAIIALARSLHMDVTAEGVETDEQLDFVREQGCDEAQGYLLARPMPCEDLITWLQAQEPRNASSASL